jgi:hypothetical protein
MVDRILVTDAFPSASSNWPTRGPRTGTPLQGIFTPLAQHVQTALCRAIRRRVSPNALTTTEGNISMSVFLEHFPCGPSRAKPRRTRSPR